MMQYRGIQGFKGLEGWYVPSIVPSLGTNLFPTLSGAMSAIDNAIRKGALR